jgi:hypothetical protein
MRDAAIAIIREIGVDTGGSNIQFALNQNNGRMVVIEMNPRVSRSSALASKATGFPIAKIAAKLAIGLTLDEIRNDITRETPASFEPTIDYVVTKFPRFAFEKFPEADPTLTTQMKSVGEVMAIGRTFKESLLKAIRSLEIGSYGLENLNVELSAIQARLKTPNAERVWYIAQALRAGMTIQDIYELTWIDPWFLNNIKQIIEMEEKIKAVSDFAEIRNSNLEETNPLLSPNKPPTPPLEKGGKGGFEKLDEGQMLKRDVRELLDETITVIEANIDDMNPQIYEYVMEKLFKKGALDVFLTQVLMKKGRPGIKLTALCKETDCEELMKIIMGETTTIGLRFYEVKRRVLQREIKLVDTEFGKVRAKFSRLGDEILKAVPEYEDCRRIAKKLNIPLVEIMRRIRIPLTK